MLYAALTPQRAFFSFDEKEVRPRKEPRW